LSVRGIQEAGWLLVSTAVMTCKATMVKGTVSLIGSGATFNLTTAVGSSPIVVNVSSKTKISIGRQIFAFSDIEVGDSVSVREYPDADGGVIASSVDLHRKLSTHTGFIADLTSSSLVLILHNDTDIQAQIQASTVVESSGVSVPLTDLADGQKVRLEGHLKPDGSIDAMKITIEAS
jgi:hypothetical protein